MPQIKFVKTNSMKSLIPILTMILLFVLTNTGNAQVKDTSKALKEVTVTAKMPLIKHKVDRIIVNVDGMITAAGSNALEVLSKSPGVFVDIDGNIQLNGKGGVLVLIDDKPTYLSAQDLAAYLRSLPAGIIDKIELISNPPARYDASGSAVINIQLKKNKTPGFNGNISIGYNQGAYARSNDALNINYRHKKVNVFSNLSYSRDAGYTTENGRRNYSTGSTTLLNKNYNYFSNGYNLRAGIDYYVSGKTTLGILLTGGIRPRSDQLNYNSDQVSTGQKPDSTALGHTAGDYQWYSSGVNLNLLHRINKKGASITGDLDYVNIHVNGSQYLLTNVYQVDGSLSSANDIMYRLPADINIWSAKTDYNLPLKGNVSLEAGYKSSWVSTDYNNSWFEKAGSNYLPDYGRSDHFMYKENINALYISAAKEWKHWAIKGGLRMENTRMHGQQPGNMVIADSAFKRNYTNFFPSFYFSWKADTSGRHTFTISYTTRIRRPSYQQLNPFLFYNDRYSYTTGNPGLRPQNLYAVELKYDYKSIFGVELAYLKVNNLIQSIVQPVGDVFVTRPDNFGINYSFNIVSWFSADVVKDWHVNAKLIVFHLINKGMADDQIVNNSINSGELEISNELRLSKKWSAELSGLYASSHLQGQTKTDPFLTLNGGIQKMILKEKGTLKLSVNDIFQGMIRRDHITTAEILSQRRVETDTRRIGIAFSYRFGKDTNNRKRNHNTGGAAEEQGRVN
ncbi:TonB-dependent receptor plug [Niastella koreensis GR20-10]|uniref:TonB-dependent receptor plug n=3 Tax=Niastella koreensis TaxID=354356 RepID=G8TEQ9_NIAKG|nr:TonB-dependent receptor plug [Niastella koreensis GR20-10]